MTLPVALPMSFNQIATEYGLPSTLSLRAFIGATGYPSSGAISMSDFLGKSAPGGGSAIAAFVSGTPSATRFGAGSVTTGSATCTATGGTPGYTYAWTRVSGDVFTINSPTAATTTFTRSLGAEEAREGVYRCTATDSLSATDFGDIAVSAASFS